MANFSRHIVLFVALFFVLFSFVAGTDHIVGGQSGWNVGVDYSAWTVGKTFFVGDNLVFKYKKGLHNVFDVNVSAFSECVAPTNQPPMESGNDIVPLKRPGTRWFLCSIGNHCESEQKLVIFVDTPPTNLTQPAFPPLSRPVPIQPSPLLPVLVLAPLPTTAAAPPPSVPSPGRNQTKPHLLAAPTPSPSQSIPPSHLPVIVPTPSVTAPPPSRASSNSAVSVWVLAIAIGVLAGIMT